MSRSGDRASRRRANARHQAQAARHVVERCHERTIGTLTQRRALTRRAPAGRLPMWLLVRLLQGMGALIWPVPPRGPRVRKAATPRRRRA